MYWKLKYLLTFLNFIQPTRKVELSKINEERRKNIKVSQLGKVLFDKKEAVLSVVDSKIEHLPIRIYKNSKQEHQKVIVYFHGGGFCFYNIESHDNICRRLCKMNDCTVISVDYRLAPEHVFPSAQEDAFLVIEYIHQHARGFGINSNKIIVCGDSAGGTLSACATHHFKNHPEIKIAGQILIYPWVDGRINSASIEKFSTGYLLTKEAILWFQSVYTPNVEDRLNPLSAPTHHTDFSNLAPAFIATAEFDPLKDEGLAYAEKLKVAGNTVFYKDYSGLIHGFANIPNIAPNGMNLFDDIKQFVEEL